MVIRPVYSPSNFGKSLRQCWIILCSPLPPSCHNHTCLILSNLSFVLATQLQRCTLLHHWLSSDSIIFSLILCSLLLFPPDNLPFLSIFILLCLLPLPLPCSCSCPSLHCHDIRVNLDPSKRQGSNKSVSGCTLPQGSKTVSKFPCLSLLSFACLCRPLYLYLFIYMYLPIYGCLPVWSQYNFARAGVCLFLLSRALIVAPLIRMAEMLAELQGSAAHSVLCMFAINAG